MLLKESKCLGCGAIITIPELFRAHIELCPKLLRPKPITSLVRVMTDDEYAAEATKQRTLHGFSEGSRGPGLPDNLPQRTKLFSAALMQAEED